MKYKLTRIYTVEIEEEVVVDRTPTEEERMESGKALADLIKAAASLAESLQPTFVGFKSVDTIRTRDYIREVD